MAPLETVDVRRDGATAIVELNRPQALNAWNRQLGLDLLSALQGVAEDDGVRAVMLKGAGRGFSSGADLRDLTGTDGERTADGLPDVERVLSHLYHPIITLV